MKYTASNPPLRCFMTQSSWYKGSTAKMAVKGVLWHSTGANNPTLKRYVQPDDKASDKSKLLALIGTNANKNDLNHYATNTGVNAWIGKLANEEVAAVQVGEWAKRPWGCGSGWRGSCNDGWIQFEICEDGLGDKAYFEKVYKEACELTAYLCKLYGLDPKGTATHWNGVNVPVILCHQDSYNLGLGSNHADVLHWFTKYGKNMQTVRNDVAALLNKPATEIQNNTKEEEDDMKYYKTLTDVPVDWRPAVKKVMEKGAMRGFSDPDPKRLDDNVINVSEDMCRMFTVLDRLGVLDK